MPFMASSATSALKAALNFRRVFFIGQKISDFIFLSSFFRPAHPGTPLRVLCVKYKTIIDMSINGQEEENHDTSRLQLSTSQLSISTPRLTHFKPF